MSLLKFNKKVSAPAVANFIFDQTTRDRLKIWVSPEAKRLLDGHTEDNVPAVELNLSTLTERSLDPPIIAELGGNEKAVVHLAHVASLIEEEALSKEGWFVAYILIGVVSWALDFYWGSGRSEWSFDVYSVEDQCGWRDGFQFLSRRLS